MKILIMNREKVESLSRKGFEPDTALISITDTDLSFAELENKPGYLLQLAFNDLDNDVFIGELGRVPTPKERAAIEKKYGMYSSKQAKSVAEFYFKVKDKAQRIICQCEYGQSRSAAVAAAIIEFRYGRGIEVFANDNYYPNKTVFKKTLKKMREYDE